MSSQGGGPVGASGSGQSQGGTSAAAEREQKLLEAASDSILQRVVEVKGTIASLIAKIENDPYLNWPSFLDSYALVSGQLNSLLKIVKNERTPVLKKYIVLPLALSPDRDEELLKMTEGRCPTFSYDLVPDYLRTKPDPDVEQKHSSYEIKASSTNADNAQKQINVMEKITRETLKHINRDMPEKDDLERGRLDMEKTSSAEDTYNLVAATGLGKGLKPLHMMRPGGMPMVPGGPMPPGPPGGPSGGPPGSIPSSVMGKAPSSIKTNIKGASQVHPYR